MLLKCFAAVISLYMVWIENPENQNSEISANTSEAGTWMNCSFEFASYEQCYHKVYFKYFDKWQMQPPEVFLDISQNSQESTCARVSFLVK